MSPGADLGDGDRLAAVCLACLVEPGTPGVGELVAEYGPQEALARVRTSRGDPPPVRGRLSAEDVPAMVADCRRRGVRVVVAGDPEFPSQLHDLPEPPLALWCRGPLDLRATALRSVSIVGARACTAYGQRATGILAGGLAAEGWGVVSGGAFGIDAAAHRAALAACGPTIAILACGLDITYPRAHDALFGRIGDVGLLVSELPPGSQPLKHRFLARNRLIAALGRGTVVVEAAQRSGALATAARALELGRVVMAVPGPITSMASSGANRLLRDNVAGAVCDSSDVVSALVGGPGPDQPTRRPPGDTPGTDDRLHGLPEHVREVLDALPRRGGRAVDVVAERAGCPPTTCLAHLGLLEIAGLARRSPSGWRRIG